MNKKHRTNTRLAAVAVALVALLVSGGAALAKSPSGKSMNRQGVTRVELSPTADWPPPPNR
jgi:hypothetical protein